MAYRMPEGAMASRKAVKVVRGVDLRRYMGRWYEVGSFPSFFQPPNAIDTRATYSLNADGTVNVLNETWSNGRRVFIQGLAYKADPNSDEAKLKVRFTFPPSVGDYWIIYLDSGYQLAVVGDPGRTSLFLLSRQAHVCEATYNKLVAKARQQGYDVTKLRKTFQSPTPPSS